MSGNHMRLSPVAFGLALGLTWALGLFVMGLLAWILGWGLPMIELMASAYIGYEPSLLGSIIGAIWGFVDLFITGLIIAWIYNCFAGKCCKKD